MQYKMVNIKYDVCCELIFMGNYAALQFRGLYCPIKCYQKLLGLVVLYAHLLVVFHTVRHRHTCLYLSVVIPSSGLRPSSFSRLHVACHAHPIRVFLTLTVCVRCFSLYRLLFQGDPFHCYVSSVYVSNGKV